VGCGELCGVALAKKHHNNKGRTWVATWRRASKQCVLRFVCAHIGILNDENWSGHYRKMNVLRDCTAVLSILACACTVTRGRDLVTLWLACRSYLREFKFKWLGTIAQLAINSVYIVWWCRGVDAIWPHARPTSAHPLLFRPPLRPKKRSCTTTYTRPFFSLVIKIVKSLGQKNSNTQHPDSIKKPRQLSHTNNTRTPQRVVLPSTQDKDTTPQATKQPLRSDHQATRF
jgi:hypothetical protein